MAGARGGEGRLRGLYVAMSRHMTPGACGCQALVCVEENRSKFRFRAGRHNILGSSRLQCVWVGFDAAGESR